MKIAIIITCYNRLESTVACLKIVNSLSVSNSWNLRIYLTDDGSTDGTYEAIIEKYPEVIITRTNGESYWNGGMRISFEKAIQDKHDRFLWLNDDTFLKRDTLIELEHTLQICRTKTNKDAIVVGTIRDKEGKYVTYGGVVFPSWWKRTTPQLVYSDTEILPCKTINGNCVWIPMSVVNVVGNLDPVFVHGLGDFDYGFRVHKAGIGLWVSPGFVGICNRNGVRNTFMDRDLPLMKRMKMIGGPKGRPPYPWAIFTYRHCGPAWICYWIFPYARVIATWVAACIARAIARAREIRFSP